MNNLKQFIERNRNTYTKHSDIPSSLIEKYQKLFKGESRLPEELIWVWENMGTGIFEDGYLQIVDPDEYEFAFEYIDKLLEPTIIWGITALGDLLLWEGNDNWTIAPDEGNRIMFLNIREQKECVQGKISTFFNYRIGSTEFIVDDYGGKPYLEMKDKLPKLKYGECYGYVPALSLGGKKSNKNIQVMDTKSYIDIIGQSVGKIVEY